MLAGLLLGMLLMPIVLIVLALPRWTRIPVSVIGWFGGFWLYHKNNALYGVTADRYYIYFSIFCVVISFLTLKYHRPGGDKCRWY